MPEGRWPLTEEMTPFYAPLERGYYESTNKWKGCFGNESYKKERSEEKKDGLGEFLALLSTNRKDKK